MIRIQSGVRRKNYHLAFSRLKIVSCVSPKFIKIYVRCFKDYKKQI
jgi:hypothetical protein